MAEGGRSLARYKIKRESVIFLVSRFVGGGSFWTGGHPVAFTDVSNSAAMQKLPWATSAPPWRIAKPGLCVEGVCENARCEAYNQMVIDNHGQGTFDLIVDAYTCKCPQCDKAINPATCAFNNCLWRFMGLKLGCAGAPETVRSDGWTDAGDWCANDVLSMV